MDNNIYNVNDELTHWGIKGMRWGIRRYQNKDGSLTPAGKKRLRQENAKLKKEEEVLKNRKSTKAKFDRLEARRKALEDDKKAFDDDGKTSDKTAKGSASTAAATPKKKSISEMSDQELAKAIERARMEDTYRQLRPEQKVEKHPMMNKVLNDVVIPAAKEYGKNAVKDLMNEAVKKITGDKVDPDSLEALKKTYDKLDYKQKIDKMLNPDKYLSEEDKNKRQQRAFEAETREAQREGYGNVQERAKATRDAQESARKAQADADARAANESKSREYYDATYTNKGAGERTQTRPNSVNELAIYNSPVTSLTKSSPAVSQGTSTVNKYKNDSVYDLLDRNGNVIRTYGDDD